MEIDNDPEKGESGINYREQAEKYDLKQAAHPRACIFTFLFKAGAILRHLFIVDIFLLYTL